MRVGLTVIEAGWLLGLRESAVRQLLADGSLAYSVYPSRVSAAAIQVRFADDALRPVREAALLMVLEGRLCVPAPTHRYAQPVRITDLAYLVDISRSSVCSIPTAGAFDPVPLNAL
jgi:hypothetical protein